MFSICNNSITSRFELAVLCADTTTNRDIRGQHPEGEMIGAAILLTGIYTALVWVMRISTLRCRRERTGTFALAAAAWPSMTIVLWLIGSSAPFGAPALKHVMTGLLVIVVSHLLLSAATATQRRRSRFSAR
jgi:hypothetical protein